MSVCNIEVSIKGISPILMNSFPLSGTPDGFSKWDLARQAEFVAYRTQEGELYIPGINIQRCFVSGATYSKGKGRASLQKPVAACVLVTPEYCLLGTKEFKVDARSVVIPATKGRIVRARPRLDTWQVSFLVEYDDVLLKEEELRKVIDESGSRVGLLDFRPEHKGPFGRFIVIEWK